MTVGLYVLECRQLNSLVREKHDSDASKRLEPFYKHWVVPVYRTHKTCMPAGELGSKKIKCACGWVGAVVLSLCVGTRLRERVWMRRLVHIYVGRPRGRAKLARCSTPDAFPYPP